MTDGIEDISWDNERFIRELKTFKLPKPPNDDDDNLLISPNDDDNLPIPPNDYILPILPNDNDILSISPNDDDILPIPPNDYILPILPNDNDILPISPNDDILPILPNDDDVLPIPPNDENIFIKLAKKKFKIHGYQEKKGNKKKKGTRKSTNKLLFQFNLDKFNNILKEEDILTYKFKEYISKSQNYYKLYLKSLAEAKINYNSLLKLIKKKHNFMLCKEL